MRDSAWYAFALLAVAHAQVIVTVTTKIDGCSASYSTLSSTPSSRHTYCYFICGKYALSRQRKRARLKLDFNQFTLKRQLPFILCACFIEQQCSRLAFYGLGAFEHSLGNDFNANFVLTGLDYPSDFERGTL
ncbi:hypothetical protein KC331_g5666 [Hortaea werneckii]|nr:hypothetical protein KC331_g5666 [Hortaea werneckii]KAI7719504.1 hypothetical protein KC353_g2931 [Hortaea werneckii]